MNDLKIYSDTIEDIAKKQIELLMKQDVFNNCKIRIMPDVHAGKGCVIGFTGNLGDKVIPNIVGVDIGCGMLCVELGDIDLDLAKLDDIIRQYIPSGFNVHDGRIYPFAELKKLKCYQELKDIKRFERSIGTLGGGNHFIEIDVDEDNNKYLIIHTGSRNLGKQVAEYYQKLANRLCNFNINEYLEKERNLIKEYKEQGRKKEIQNALRELKREYETNQNRIPKELAYLEGQNKEDYLNDMKICQNFATINRMEIAGIILNNIFGENMFTLVDIRNMNFEQAINANTSLSIPYFETIHNYISFSDSIVRKGAISAHKGELVLIPMNMRDGCIIAVGKGNDDWNCSAPHGAGRILSRSKAKEQLSMDDYIKSMHDIFTTSINENTIDESPMCYKPVEEIIKYIDETVEVKSILKPIYNFKAFK